MLATLHLGALSTPSLTHAVGVALHHPDRFGSSETGFGGHVVACSTDLVEQTVRIAVEDDVDGHVIAHLLAFAVNQTDAWTLSLSRVSRSGDLTGIIRFDDLTLSSHTAAYTGAVGGTVRHDLVLSYGSSTLLPASFSGRPSPPRTPRLYVP